ncbi:MAG: DMT family transporter [Cyanobacteria bacterium P01_G01_bin.54]
MPQLLNAIAPRGPFKLVLVTTMAMLAFAANSLLCREALASGNIGAASFTLVRIVSGAVVLALLLLAKRRTFTIAGKWRSASALFGYAATFSYAYVTLSAATGALLLFGAVQVTMIAYGLWAGERLNLRQVIGSLFAAGGLVWLLLPGVESPPLLGAVLMLFAGFSWGVYSLLGRGEQEPTIATAGNFIRATPLAMILLMPFSASEANNVAGFGYAMASGALASGMGYALWYAVLPSLPATTAASVQLSAPILAALGGVLLLGEAMTFRFVVASVVVLGGIALFICSKTRFPPMRLD